VSQDYSEYLPTLAPGQVVEWECNGKIARGEIVSPYEYKFNNWSIPKRVEWSYWVKWEKYNDSRAIPLSELKIVEIGEQS